MPDWKARVRERLSGLELDPATEVETVEELTQHVEDRYRDLVASRMPENDAAAQAWRELEGHPRLAREISIARKFAITTPLQEHSRGRLDAWWDDFRFAWRRLRHAPGFAVIALLTITLTVGANTAILSVADAVLFRPLPYADAGNVAIIQAMDARTGRQYTNTAYVLLQAIDDGCPDVSQVALLEDFGGTGRATIATPDGPRLVPLLGATPNYFTLLGARPLRGRVFSEHDAGQENSIAVLSHAAWVELFGRDESVVGRQVSLGAVTLNVVGVLPPGFVFPSKSVDRLAIVTMRGPMARGEKGGTFYPIVRIAQGVSRERAQAQVLAATAAVSESLTRPESVPMLNDVRTVLYPVGRPVMRFLLTAAVLILLLGCANLANMMIVRGRRGLHDTAIRLALGASRSRLIRPVLIEALLLGFGGALLAVGLTTLTFEVLLQQVPPAAYNHGRVDVGVDGRVVAAALAMGLLCAVSFSIIPAWRATGVDVLALIQRRGGRGSRVRLGRSLVAVQVAIAVAVVFGAAIAGRAFISVLNIPLGFSADRVALITAGPGPAAKDKQGFFRQVLETLERRPDVVAVGGVSMLPFSMSAPDSGTADRKAGVVYALPGYFEATAIPLIRGRTLTWDDATADPGGAVVSQTAARELFGDREPIGATFEDTGGGRYRVVGVVGDVVGSLAGASPPLTYVMPGPNVRRFVFVARLRERRAGTVTAIKQDIRTETGITPSLNWWEDRIKADNGFRDPRFQTIVLASLATLALLLTALGIFSVVAYLVSARTREMGVRLAIGASPKSLVGLMVREALWPVVAGLAASAALIVWGRQLAEAQLSKVDATDPGMLALASVTVVVAALLAAYLPARRALRISPTEVLRAD